MALPWRKSLMSLWRIKMPSSCIRILYLYIILAATITLFTVVMYNDMLSKPTYNEATGYSKEGASMAKRRLDNSIRLAEFVFSRNHPGMYNTTAFFQLLTTSQTLILMDLARKVDGILRNKSIPYIIYGGSLLGSYRHHNIIPWDDDIDILVDSKARRDLYFALKELHPEYTIMASGPRWKFFSKLSNRTSKYPWGWPYIDIHFYEENVTHIWDSGPDFSNYIYNKNIVFPTHDRPLGGLNLSAPRDSYANIRATYRTVSCQSHHYSHKKEKILRKKPNSVPCALLKYTFPFVHRSPAKNGVMETLKLGDTVLHTLLVDEPSYAITRPYSLTLTRKH